MRTLLWFRGKDLRLADHTPLADAVANGDVIPLFVLDPYFFEPVRAQALPHRMQYLLDALAHLKSSLRTRGSDLLLVRGPSTEVVPRVAHAWRVDRVVAQRWTEPLGRERDRRVASALAVPFELHEGELLYPPGLLRSASGRPYSVFTPFSRRFLREVVPGKPLKTPRKLPAIPRDVPQGSEEVPTLEALGLQRNSSLIEGGEKAARKRLRDFLECSAGSYRTARDILHPIGTSRLSADLKFGCLSPREVWHSLQTDDCGVADRLAFQRQLLWREFTHATLWDRPSVLRLPFQARFIGFPWRKDEREWTAWKLGKTGYPIVDAAARQLLTEGFVHNRARMITASFLTKHLLIDYRRGEAHYLEYLVDGDWAQNNAGWQWAAGTGCDAQPYFRVFNPTTQGQKFDAQGNYVRRWLPQLTGLPNRFIHEPWKAPPSVLREAKIDLGVDYPLPIVEHRAARERYLAVAKRHLTRKAPTRTDYALTHARRN